MPYSCRFYFTSMFLTYLNVTENERLNVYKYWIAIIIIIITIIIGYVIFNSGICYMLV